MYRKYTVSSNIDNVALITKIHQIIELDKFVLPTDGYFKNYYSGWNHYMSQLGDSYFDVDFQNNLPENENYIYPHLWPELEQLAKEITNVTSENIILSWLIGIYNTASIPAHTHPKANKSVCIYYPQQNVGNHLLELYNGLSWIPVIADQGDFVVFSKDALHRVPTVHSDAPIFIITFNL